MDIGAIKARIAELEQRKAERNALRGYRDLAYLDYMTQGDRSGFDKIEADEVAYRNMLKQQAQQERLLGLQQTQQDKMLAAQQDFTARENELNRQNAKDIAEINRTNANEAKLDAIEKELNSLVITKQTLEAQGKDSREVTARIEQIYKNYPSIQRPQLTEYDPETDVNYVLAKSGEMNYMDNAGENELEDMLSTVKNYRTPEAAKERVRLEREIIKRNKAAQFKEQLDKDIANYWKTGVMSDLMLQLGFEEAGVAGNRYLLQGNKIHRRPKKKGGSVTPTTFQTT